MKLKLNRQQIIVLASFLFLLLLLVSSIIYVKVSQQPASLHKGKETAQERPPTPTNAPAPIPLPAGKPTLDRLEQVTDQAFGTGGDYVPNSWGMQKSRIIRTSTNDIFTVYITEGSEQNRIWHLMHRPLNGGWEELKTGNAGSEPINILRGPHDEIHLFGWPGRQGRLEHTYSTDVGKSFQTETIPGQWDNQQGYSGASINEQGDITFFQTGEDQPGRFLWTFYSHQSNQWQFHISTFDYRYTYAFSFTGDRNDLTMVGVRDVKREELGYAQSSDFDYIFNSIKYFHIDDVNNPNLTEKVVASAQPQNTNDYDITYLTDSYIDTQGRTHILYNNQYEGDDTIHHIILQNGQVIKDVQQNVTFGKKTRITQDTKGRFYIITVSNDGNSLNIYPGSTNDSDGTQLDPVVKLDISKYPGCTNDDYCHPPTFTVPRSGNPLSDYIDGIYGNFKNEFYFRVKLRGDASKMTDITPNAAYSASRALLSSSQLQSFVVLDEKRRVRWSKTRL